MLMNRPYRFRRCYGRKMMSRQKQQTIILVLYILPL